LTGALGYKLMRAQQIRIRMRVLLRDPQSGGAVTFDEFVSRHLPAVLRFAAVLTGDRISSEDIVQEVLIRAHARWSRISVLDRPEFYVRKMVLNEFRSARRRSRRLVPAGSAADVDDRVVPDHSIGYADRAVLLADIAKLPAQQRAVVVLRYYEGLADADIAHLLNLAPGTVRGYASRALAALRIESVSEAGSKVRIDGSEKAEHENRR
jgi:RNA polymerase sigma-70 factor (sigma-E family)